MLDRLEQVRFWEPDPAAETEGSHLLSFVMPKTSNQRPACIEVF